MKKIYNRIVLIFVWGLVFGEGYSQNPLVKQWDKRFGGTDWDELHCFQQTKDGGFILGGLSYSGINGDKTQQKWGGSDFWIVKIDSLGNKQWDRTFGGTGNDTFHSLWQTADGGYIFGGNSISDSSGNKTQDVWHTASGDATYDYWIVKTDSLGNKQWDKDFGGTLDDYLFSLQQTTEGGYILGGHSNSDISGDKTQPKWGGMDFWIVKIDSLGNKLWDKDFGGTSGDRLYSLQQTTDGGYILGGESYSDSSGDKTQNNWDTICTPFCTPDYWIIKIDSSGNKQWNRNFGGTSYDGLRSMQQTSDDGYILGGFSESDSSGNKTQHLWGFGGWDYWVVKTDMFGNKQWEKDYGGIGLEDLFGNISQTADGGYLASGTSYSFISGDKTENNLGVEQIWVLKSDSLGIKQWDKTIFTNGHDESGYAIQTKGGCYAMANSNAAGIGGYKTQSNWNNSEDYWIVKFCDTTSITSIPTLQSSTFNLQLFPNPATGTIQLTFNTKHNAPLECEIMNVMGERVFTSPLTPLRWRGESSAVLDVSFLAKGIYLVRVGDGESFENKKLVIK